MAWSVSVVQDASDGKVGVQQARLFSAQVTTSENEEQESRSEAQYPDALCAESGGREPLFTLLLSIQTRKIRTEQKGSKNATILASV